MTRTRFAILLIATVCFLLTVGPVRAAQEKNAPPKQDEKKPGLKVIQKVDPVYPIDAEREGVEGKVVLKVTVETNGEVSDASILSGHRLLNQAAIDAVKQWRFSNTYDGPVTIQLTFAFGDTDDPTPEPAKPEQSAESGVKVMRKVTAVYPEEARAKRVEGEVAVEITINEKGEVTDARVKSGNELLRQAAIDAVKQFRFSNGLQKTVMATMTFNFVLGDKEKDAPKKPQG